MTDDLKTQATDVARAALPWRKGIPWWLVLIEGVVLLGLGLWLFFARQTALTILGWIIALSLAAGGALSLYLAFQAEEQTSSRQWTMIHGITGLAVAGLIVLSQLLGWLSGTGAAVILGLGCLVYGGVALYMLFEKSLTPLRRLSIINAVFFLVVGALLLLQAFGAGTFVFTVQFITFIIIGAGLILILWSIILKNDAGRAQTGQGQ